MTEYVGTDFPALTPDGGRLCVVVANDITRRLWKHKAKEVRGFTAKYGVVLRP